MQIKILLFSTLIAAHAYAGGVGLPDGIYADFQTTMGSFTARLAYAESPMTVANFVSLAEGSRAWMDASGAVRTDPFYDGIIFHRVVHGFMNQAGSPNKLGTDGPGYQFPDELPNGLDHSLAGTLSMANSGYETNGSQFFVTVRNTQQLDGKHTVFGNVIGGMDVVNAINSVATNVSERPVVDVTIESLQILRIGTEAQNFDVHAQGLPEIRTTGISNLVMETDAAVLTFEPQHYGDYYVRTSSNLVDWVSNPYNFFRDPPDTNDVTITGLDPSVPGFFNLTEVQYPGNTLSPERLTNRTLNVLFTHPDPSLAGVEIEYVFNNTNGGTYASNATTTNGTIVGYFYEKQPYPERSLLFIQGSGLVRVDYRLAFLSATNGTFTGAVYFALGTEEKAQGVFSLSP